MNNWNSLRNRGGKVPLWMFFCFRYLAYSAFHSYYQSLGLRLGKEKRRQIMEQNAAAKITIRDLLRVHDADELMHLHAVLKEQFFPSTPITVKSSP